MSVRSSGMPSAPFSPVSDSAGLASFGVFVLPPVQKHNQQQNQNQQQTPVKPQQQQQQPPQVKESAQVSPPPSPPRVSSNPLSPSYQPSIHSTQPQSIAISISTAESKPSTSQRQRTASNTAPSSSPPVRSLDSVAVIASASAVSQPSNAAQSAINDKKLSNTSNFSSSSRLAQSVYLPPSISNSQSRSHSHSRSQSRAHSPPRANLASPPAIPVAPSLHEKLLQWAEKDYQSPDDGASDSKSLASTGSHSTRSASPSRSPSRSPSPPRPRRHGRSRRRPRNTTAAALIINTLHSFSPTRLPDLGLIHADQRRQKKVSSMEQPMGTTIQSKQLLKELFGSTAYEVKNTAKLFESLRLAVEQESKKDLDEENQRIREANYRKTQQALKSPRNPVFTPFSPSSSGRHRDLDAEREGLQSSYSQGRYDPDNVSEQVKFKHLQSERREKRFDSINGSTGVNGASNPQTAEKLRRRREIQDILSIPEHELTALERWKKEQYISERAAAEAEENAMKERRRKADQGVRDRREREIQRLKEKIAAAVAENEKWSNEEKAKKQAEEVEIRKMREKMKELVALNQARRASVVADNGIVQTQNGGSQTDRSVLSSGGSDSGGPSTTYLAPIRSQTMSPDQAEFLRREKEVKRIQAKLKAENKKYQEMQKRLEKVRMRRGSMEIIESQNQMQMQNQTSSGATQASGNGAGSVAESGSGSANAFLLRGSHKVHRIEIEEKQKRNQVVAMGRELDKLRAQELEAIQLYEEMKKQGYGNTNANANANGTNGAAANPYAVSNQSQTIGPVNTKNSVKSRLAMLNRGGDL